MSNTTRSNTRRDRAAWEQLMMQYETGNISQRLFCEQHGIAYSTFGYWRKQLRQSAPLEKPSTALVELPMFPLDQTPDWRVELDLGRGVVLRMK